MKNHIRLVLGSPSDTKHANVLIQIWQACGISYGASNASCHRNAGRVFEEFIAGIEEKIVVYIGGMEFAAPGILESVLRNKGILGKVVFAIPTDRAARSAVENLPAGTALVTSGLNEGSLSHSLKNSALAVANLAGVVFSDQEILKKLHEYHTQLRSKKPLLAEVTLVEGLIVENE